MEEARILGHANTLGQTLSFAAGLLPALCRDEARLEEGVAELVTHTNEHRLPFWEAFADATLGRLRYMQGRFDEAIEAIDRGIAGYEAQSVVRWRPTFFVWLAESHAKSEAYSEALNAIDAALDLINEYGERWFEAEVYRVKGEILRNMRPHDPVSAEALFFRAKESARSCSARSLELRATTELARVLESQYKQRYAHKLLAPLYGWFTEGFDTADLKDAKALLESLS